MSPLVAAVLALVVQTWPAVVRADGLCIDQAVGTPAERLDWSFCDGGCYDGVVHPSAEAALLALAAAPDNVNLCVGTIGLHTETVVADNTDGSLGPGVGFLFPASTEPNICPDPGTESTQPLFTVLGDEAQSPQHGLIFSGLSYDPSACDAQRSMIAAHDVSSVGLSDSRVVGFSGSLVEVSTAAETPILDIQRSRIEACTGPLLSGDATVLLSDSEIAGCVSDAPLLTLPAGLQHEITSTALFGNTVSGGAPLIEVQGDLLLDVALVAANVVLDSAPLIGVTLPEPNSASQLRLFRSVFSRNRLLSSGTVDGPTTWPRTAMPPDMDDVCLPWGSDQLDYLGRADLTVTAPELSDAALIDVDGGVGPSTGLVALYKSFVVHNEWGPAGAVLRTSGELPDLQLLLVHDTVGDHPGLLVDGGGTGPGAALGSARNLLAGAPVVALGGAFDAVDASMDQVEAGNQAWLDGFSTFQGVRGPTLPALPWTGLFVSFAEQDTHLDRALTLCPDSYGDPSGFPPGCSAPCALDLASNWIPDPVEIPDHTWPWPWRDTILPGLPFGDLQNVPGATGWGCDGQLPLAWDRVDLGGGPSGDGDGYSSLVDCDNGSDATVPELPPNDGYSTSECDHFEDDCYLCPDEFGDDDDSGQDDDDSAGPDDDDSADPDDDDSAGPNDDDSAEVDDDDDTGDDDDSHDDIWDDTGCDAAGCGYSWELGGLVVLVPVGFRRRR